RFPGSADLQQFWEHLKSNHDLVTEVPADRWDWRQYHGDPLASPGKTLSRWGGFITDIDKFDALYFNISPLEAELMDPQQRITLEAVYGALEDAGIAPGSLKGSNTGVFIGVASSDYAGMLRSSPAFSSQAQYATGSAHSVLVNRISYLLDIHGPSEPVDTACSSSLVAIHRAVEHIRNGDCDMAIAGGVNALLSPDLTLSFSQAGMLSAEGRCMTFDQRANGYVRGEGVGIIILKPLSRAVSDGDQIYGVIRGSAVNHGGKANTLTSPNPVAQRDLLLKAYRNAGIAADRVSYIEAHGTGTALGDPIEMDGLQQAFRELYAENNLVYPGQGDCRVGSVKSNIGHLEAAAGIAGVIKVLLSMKHGLLPGNPHLQRANEYIKLEGSIFRLSASPERWEDKSSLPLVAGVSSFGFGGANAHVVLEAYDRPGAVVHKTDVHPVIVVLSARNQERLFVLANNLLVYLEGAPDTDLRALGYTLQTGRDALEERLAMVVTDHSALQGLLRQYLSGETGDYFTGNTKKERTDFLLEGGAGRAYIDYALTHREHRSLARLWVRGIIPDWKQLYADNKPVKISLPGYPFARERYWIPANEATMRSATKYEEKSSIEKIITAYAETWVPAILDNNMEQNARVLVLTNGFSKGLITALRNTLGAIEVVSSVSDFVGTLETVTGLIDLTPLEAGHPVNYEWITLLQKIITTATAASLKLMIVNEEQTDGDHIRGADRFGLYGMLQAEYSKVHSQHVRLPAGLADIDKSRLITTAYASRNAGTKVRYHNESWHVPQLKEIRLEKSLKRHCSGPVLITGGTRGIGMACARHLVAAHNIKNLILLGREVLPDRDSWEERKQEDSRIGQKIRDVLSLEAAGAVVEVVNIPLTEKEKLREYLDNIQRVWGPVKGLLHAAGYVDDHTYAFIDKTRAGITALQVPKVQGLENLHELLQENDLDFAVLFSSLSSVVPRLGAGFSDYVMANSFMDNFAAFRRQQGYRYTSVQWSSWKEAGIGEMKGGLYGELGFLSMTNKEALAILDCILMNDECPPVVFSAVYDPAKFDSVTAITIPEKASIQEPSAMHNDRQSPDITDWLKGQVGIVLRMDPRILDNDTNFQEYGVDSIVLSLLVKRLETQLNGMAVSPNVILEYPTINLLAGYLKEQCPEGLLALLNGQDISFSETVQTAKADVTDPVNKTKGSVLSELDISAISSGNDGGLLPLQMDSGFDDGLQQLCQKSILKILLDLGIRDHRYHTVTGLRKALGVVDKYQRLFAELVRISVNAGLLVWDETGQVSIPPEVGTTATYSHTAALQQLRERYPNFKGVLNLLEMSLDAFPEIITGMRKATDVMFPEGNMAYVAAVYKGNRYADYFNELLTNAVSNAVEAGVKQLRPGERIRILEVGAGTGGTSELIFKKLVPYSDYITYAYTDVSRSFLHYAEETYKTIAPYLTTAVFDIGQPPASQHLPEHTYDIVIAANVVHATRDIAVSLQNMRKTMKPDGLLLLNEIAVNSVFNTLTFGLLDGWWLFEDEERRMEGGPALSADSWKQVLAANGFNKSGSFPEGGGKEQQLVIAVNTNKKMTPVTAAESGKKEGNTHSSNNRIAVVGMACHFPDAPDIASFWENLKNGRDSIREVPASRWSVARHYAPGGATNGKSISKWGAFLDGIEDFDPAYFGIHPSLAQNIDPLERQWLEVSAEALADAGFSKKDLWGKSVGVFAGSRVSNFSDKVKALPKDILVGVGQNFITAHLAHIYNFTGPNMVVDTGCSSAVTAISLAVDSLLSGETEAALAGGVDILLNERTFITLSAAGVLSPDGRSKTFDESANGIGLGEGCGVLVLKRLDDAVRAGDKIYGVIEGAAINNDGNTMGVTTPNPAAQLNLLKRAVAKSGVDVATISYIETHGTATHIGDPIELKAINRLFEAHTSARGICGIGSVKSNIGHLLSAAGVAGVIKTLLSMNAGQLPPTLHCNTPNRRFDFDNSAVYPVRVLTEWPGVNGVRRAGVSAFGLGGSNGHLILSNEGIPAASVVSSFAPPQPGFKRQRHWPEEEKYIVESDIAKAVFMKYLNTNFS
ncbi:beta-ketoacyl synthase N-terminal-like domain-containing protein, partial [Chitinophaga sp. 22308]|uniref:beta-ketoacyl synthase N-terminal-like domain-containing protein n=1 Tax=Chitinophaga sp. 22308 TaxID=3453906 RepID=UPI003F82CF43